MDCCNYVPYRHHQGYYGYYNEPLPPYHGEFYGHHNMYHDYYGNINPYYSPHQHWQGAGVFAPQDYVYNPKEARLRKAMREAANRDRSIGASPMLPRPSARRAGTAGWPTPGAANSGAAGGPVTPTSHGAHEEPLMMSPLGQNMRGPRLDSPCFPTGMSSTSAGINGSDQFMSSSMEAATPSPGYPAAKMDQVSPLPPPPPAPTPGVHAPYMQSNSTKNEMSATSNINKYESNTMRIQFDKDAKQQDNELSEKEMSFNKETRRVSIKPDAEFSEEQESVVSQPRSSGASRVSLFVPPTFRPPRISLIEGSNKKSRSEKLFSTSEARRKISHISQDGRQTKSVERKTTLLEEEKEKEQELENEKNQEDSYHSMHPSEYEPSSLSLWANQLKQQERKKTFRTELKKIGDQPHKLINVIERERKRQEERRSLVNRMRKNLPKYNLSEIRELRLPYHEAVFINMEDNGYYSTAAFGKEILAFQENQRKHLEPGSIMLSKPLLKSSKEEFSLLMQTLKKAEDYHRQNQITGECDEFLKLAIKFAFAVSDDWWWLGEQLLLQLIKISTNYASEQGRTFEALGRYTYGRYLLEKLKDFKAASEQLQISRSMAEGKGWSCKAYFEEMRGTLFMQCNHAIYDCMLREVKFLMSTFEYEKGIALAEQARKRAAEACHRKGETEALVLKGICEMETGNLRASISSLLRAYNIEDRYGNIEGLCKIRIHLAKAYLMDKRTTSSLNVLLELKQDAEEFQLPYYLGLAYKNLGQYYLLIGENHKALPLLQQAMIIFEKCDASSTSAREEIQSTKTLKEISGGLQLFPKFIKLLLGVPKPDPVGKESLKSLLLWKDERKKFWRKLDNVFMSCEDILKESMKKIDSSKADYYGKTIKEVTGR